MTTTEQANRLSASLHRQLFLLKMLSYEWEQFKDTPVNGGIKTAIGNALRCYENAFNQVKKRLPHTPDFEKYHLASDEHVRAMSQCVVIMSALSEDEILKLEEEFSKSVRVCYETEIEA